nr:hypothetical protein [Rhodococcus yananensis]
MTMRDDATRVSLSPFLPVLITLVCTALGIGLGFAAPPVSRWAVDTLPAVPGPLELLAELTTSWSVPILTVVGVAAGIVVAVLTVAETLAVTVDSDGVLLEQDDEQLYVPKSRVRAAFLDGKDLVLTDEARHELARRGAGDLNSRELASAFGSHGYPWLDADPHEGEFCRWIDGHPDLDDELHAILRMRRDALAAKDTGVVLGLHAKLRERGIVVRDRGGRQEFRRTTR